MRAAAELFELFLTGRGIGPDKRHAFLKPDFERDLPDASRMAGMTEAVRLLESARGATVLVFGDYDADGVPATALILRVLRRAGYAAEGLIPKRSEGYGLTEAAVRRIIESAPGLLICVDNGTVATAEVAALREAGIRVIVIDHHEPHGEVAAPDALLNPKQAGCPYPYREHCACALAWLFLVQAAPRIGLDPKRLRWELDLVALSTVGDMVPLDGANRLLAVYGLRVLRQSRNQGLLALMLEAGLDPATADAAGIGFGLAPRINAPSRMHAEELDGVNAPLALLVTDDAAEAGRLAAYLGACNAERQALVRRTLIEAEGQVGTKAGVVVAYGEGWSTGVIGLVASRLVERTGKPAVALASEGGTVKGSARTTGSLHALEMLGAVADQLERFGGHAKAAGLTLLSTPERFRAALEAAFPEPLEAEPRRQADIELEAGEATLGLIDALAGAGPYGIGFPPPRVAVRGTVAGARMVGKDAATLSFTLRHGGVELKAVAFRWAGPLPSGPVEVVGELEADEWNGRRKPSLKVLDPDGVTQVALPV